MSEARSGTPVNPDNFVKVNRFLADGDTVDLGAGPVDEYDHCVDIVEEYSPDTVHNLEESLPFEDNLFTNAVAVHVIEHVSNDRQMLQEMQRVATDRVVVVVPIGARPATDDHERELDKDEWLDRYSPGDWTLSSMAGYYDLVMVWRL